MNQHDQRNAGIKLSHMMLGSKTFLKIGRLDPLGGSNKFVQAALRPIYGTKSPPLPRRYGGGLGGEVRGGGYGGEVGGGYGRGYGGGG